MGQTILVVGAYGGIAQAYCRLRAAAGDSLILAGRNADELARLAADLKVRGAPTCEVEPFDAGDPAAPEALFARLAARPTGLPDGVLIAHGLLPDEARARTDAAYAKLSMDVNFTSCVALLVPLANAFEARKSGWLAVIGSVAGDRGRQSNYTYGAAKAGLATYLQGLRNRLQPAGVPVLTIKPGFVDTPMTVGKINPKSPLVASPEKVAGDIDRAIRRRADVLYTPWFWWGILSIVNSIPEFVFKRMKM